MGNLVLVGRIFGIAPGSIMNSPKGNLALVLHAHLPFVRHPEHEQFLEEDWLYEAITETYIPLIDSFQRMVSDGVDFRITMSVTPPLCAMLRDELLQERYARHLAQLLALCDKEAVRVDGDDELRPVVDLYHSKLTRCCELFVDQWKCEIIPQLKALQEQGVLEIITCAATHGFLPLMQQFPEAVRAQILIARDDYRECFDRDPVGIWLPECAYFEGLDAFLQEANIRWFILDAHGLMFADPRPENAIYAPIFTPTGPAAFGRDRDSSRQVWSAEEGYPGDPAYRDFYRDIGFDLSKNYLAENLTPTGERKFTGLKYHRITGDHGPKEIYNRGWAMAAADAHAGHFMQSRVEQFRQLNDALPCPPIILSPFDAELFGHWWFEGPEFLELFMRKSVYDQSEYKLTTPSIYLVENPIHQVSMPSTSSWGNMGYFEVWLDDSNSWIYPHLHAAARRMISMATVHQRTGKLTPTIERVLQQMARELLLAQSSDWAFLMKTDTAPHYATKRTKDHILRFTRLYDQLRGGAVNLEFLAECESRDNLFPSLNWHYFAQAD